MSSRRRLRIKCENQEYEAGWHFGDLWCSVPFADLTADAPTHWSDEKCIGFWDRLAAERGLVSGELNACHICTRMVPTSPPRKINPFNCGDPDCIPF